MATSAPSPPPPPPPPVRDPYPLPVQSYEDDESLCEESEETSNADPNSPSFDTFTEVHFPNEATKKPKQKKLPTERAKERRRASKRKQRQRGKASTIVSPRDSISQSGRSILFSKASTIAKPTQQQQTGGITVHIHDSQLVASGLQIMIGGIQSPHSHPPPTADQHPQLPTPRSRMITATSVAPDSSPHPQPQPPSASPPSTTPPTPMPAHIISSPHPQPQPHPIIPPLNLSTISSPSTTPPTLMPAPINSSSTTEQTAADNNSPAMDSVTE